MFEYLHYIKINVLIYNYLYYFQISIYLSIVYYIVYYCINYFRFMVCNFRMQIN